MRWSNRWHQQVSDKSTGNAAVLELEAPYPGDVHKSDIKATYLHKRMVSLGLELPRSTHRRSSQDLRGDELDETTAI